MPHIVDIDGNQVEPGPISADSIAREFKRFQDQKSRKQGGVEARTLLNICMLAGEQHVYQEAGRILASFDPREQNRPHMVHNRMHKNLHKVIGRLMQADPVFSARPDTDDPADLKQSVVVEKLIRAISQKVKEDSLARKRWWWMMVGGVAFEHTPWRPDVVVEPVAVNDPETGELLWEDQETEEIVTDSQRRELVDPQVLDPVSGQPLGRSSQLPPETIEQLVESGVIQPPVPVERFEPLQQLKPEGDIKPEILGPLNVFLPNSVTSISDLAPDQAVLIARVRTEAWIRANFPEFPIDQVEPDDEIKIVKTDLRQVDHALSGQNVRDMIPVVQGTVDDNEEKLFTVVERYQPISGLMPPGWSGDPDGNGGRYTVSILGEAVLDDGEIPYADGIPLVDFHWQAPTTTFWNGGWAEHIIPAQKAYNKSWSQLREYANAFIMSPVLLGGISPDDWPTDFPGFVPDGLGPDGSPQARRMEVPQIPSWFINSIERLQQEIDDLSGGQDLFQEPRFPGQIRGSMAIAWLQEVMDSEWGPILTEYGQRLAEVNHQRINRVKQFYPPVRTLHYVDDMGRNETFTFHKSHVLSDAVDYNITVERGSLIPEFKAMRQARILEILNGPAGVLYTNDSGSLDKTKLARDLRFGDFGREEKEARQRTFAAEVVNRIISGRGDVPPVMPNQNHEIFLEEIDAVVNDMDFFELTPSVQQALLARSQEHVDLLNDQMDAQNAALANEQSEAAIAQATQQVSAKIMADLESSIVEPLIEMIRERFASDPMAAAELLGTAQTDNEVQ